jgi:hypothetical protein
MAKIAGLEPTQSLDHFARLIESRQLRSFITKELKFRDRMKELEEKLKLHDEKLQQLDRSST